MSIDPSSFYLHNVTDTCAVWNVLSSKTLYSGARRAGVVFICTRFVIDECLYKQRTSPSQWDMELQNRLRQAQNDSSFECYPLDIADLQTINLLENRKRLGKGELSALAFALKTRQAFLTDDKKARRFAQEILSDSKTQTTPHLVGWLFFRNHLSDGDKDVLLREHQGMGRPLSEYFDQMYMEACRCRLMSRQGVSSNGR